jgi:hypothetical protein
MSKAMSVARAKLKKEQEKKMIIIRRLKKQIIKKKKAQERANRAASRSRKKKLTPNQVKRANATRNRPPGGGMGLMGVWY